jgi:hypothetical protein
MTQAFGERGELERGAFLAYLQGRPLPQLPWREILLPWAVSIALLALQAAMLVAVIR